MTCPLCYTDGAIVQLVAVKGEMYCPTHGEVEKAMKTSQAVAATGRRVFSGFSVHTPIGDLFEITLCGITFYGSNARVANQITRYLRKALETFETEDRVLKKMHSYKSLYRLN